MHLAAAVGTPVVAVFGPSDPRRYAPLVARRRIVRIDTAVRARATGSACRRSAAAATCPTAWRGCRASAVYEAARSAVGRAGTSRGGQAVSWLETPLVLRSSRRDQARHARASSSTPSDRDARAERGDRVDQGRAAPARRRRDVPRPLHAIAAIRCGGSPSSSCTRRTRSRAG